VSNAKRRYRRRRRDQLFWAHVEQRRQVLIVKGYRLMAQVGCFQVWMKLSEPMFLAFGETPTLQTETVGAR